MIDVLYAAAQSINTDVDLSFPYAWDETGRCEKLGDDNRCTVYEKRPLICRVDACGDAFGMSREDNHRITANSCNAIMDKFGIDKSLNVVL